MSDKEQGQAGLKEEGMGAGEGAMGVCVLGSV